jgi:hypothetical protein
MNSATVRLRGLAARLLRRHRRDRAIIAAEFDAAYYRGANPDVIASGFDPLDHFLAYGWREGRDPTALFSVQDYLESNPDVAAAGVNPFVHYVEMGREEGRPTSHGLGFRYEAIRRLVPIEDQVAAVARLEAAMPLGPASALTAGLSRARTGLRDLHITFSHDDYRTRVGGVQLCLQQEAARLEALGRDHLHLSPPKSWPTLRPAGIAGRLEVLLNGQALGTYAPAVVAEALAGACRGRPGARSFAIHSLLGHDAAETADIVEAAGQRTGFYWLHDYASLCAGFNLLRNGVEDCGAPAPDSGACGICVFGEARRAQHEAHELLFRRLALTVVSPAAATLDFWRARTGLPAAATLVHPHARLVERESAPVPPAGRPLRVAFLGHAAVHKGWPIFRDVALGHADDPRYRFVHLGAAPEPGMPFEFHRVSVDAARPRAMTEALEALEADVVLFWPLWRETFSFAAHEAVAAGCALVTGPDSGAVAALVTERGCGWVLPDEAALAEAFASGSIAALSRTARKPMLYDLPFSGMTADLLRARAAA